MESADVETQTKLSFLRSLHTKSVRTSTSKAAAQELVEHKYTLRRAQKLSIRGWCMNTNYGTVLGLIQGSLRGFEAMRLWLKYTGSPTSRIDRCVFGPTTELEDFTFDEFTIRM